MQLPLKRKILRTPLGLMMAEADDHALYQLRFVQTPDSFEESDSPPLLSIKNELKAYFDGTLKAFKTPLQFQGTSFQKGVWKALNTIPYGKTWSYSDLAASVGKPTAFRAVAQANCANRFVIVIPCHRVINKDGTLGGYACGLERKTWLIKHEETVLRKR